MAFQKIAAYIDITSSLSAGWNDIDVTAQGWSGCTGVEVYFKMTDQFGRGIGLRKKGSTDARTTVLPSTGATYGAHTVGFTGIDGDDIFQVYVGETTYIKVIIVGYFDSNAVFFTNAYDESLGSTATITDIDIAAETSTDTAIAGIFEVDDISGTSDFFDFFIRDKDSTDAFYKGTSSHFAFGFISGVDANEVCQGKIETLNINFYLVGYITAGVLLYINAVDISITANSTWTDIALTYSNIGALIEEVGDNSGWDVFGFRRNGYTGSDIAFRGNRSHSCWVMDTDDNKILEGYVRSGYNTAFYLRGEFGTFDLGMVNALFMFGMQF